MCLSIILRRASKANCDDQVELLQNESIPRQRPDRNIDANGYWKRFSRDLPDDWLASEHMHDSQLIIEYVGNMGKHIIVSELMARHKPIGISPTSLRIVSANNYFCRLLYSLTVILIVYKAAH